MNSFSHKIYENEINFSLLAQKQFSDSTGITRDNIKEVLSKRGAEIRGLITETNLLIAENITPFLENPHTLTLEHALEFESMAEKLSSYTNHLDIGLAYELRYAVVQYAKYSNNEELYIKNLFFSALTLFFLSKELFLEEINQHFDEIISYSVNYVNYSDEIRQIINRAYGNSYISLNNEDIDLFFQRVHRALDFWKNVAQLHDPEFAWDRYYFNVKENICSSCLTYLRSHPKSEDIKKYLPELLSAAKEYYDHTKLNTYTSNHYVRSNIRPLYFYKAAQYYNGLISFDEFLTSLYDIYQNSTDEYTLDNIFMKLHISGLFLFYLNSNDTETSKYNTPSLLNAIQEDVFTFMRNVPTDVPQNFVTSNFNDFAVGSGYVFNNLEFFRIILSLTVFRHKPTFVHSVMVGNISLCIYEALLESNPEYFLTLPNIHSVADVYRNRTKISNFIWRSSLLHDMGKITYAHMISMYIRRLTDKEFIMIKDHASKAFMFSIHFKYNETTESEIRHDFLSENEKFEYYSHVAAGHHRSFDGESGYPFNFDNYNSKVKCIIDIVSIADALDAATDIIGRSYAHGKDLNKVIQELSQHAGSKYNPVITKLLTEDEDLRHAIIHKLEVVRFDTYYDCFHQENLDSYMSSPCSETK